MGLYTPEVVIIRSDMASGHKLLVSDTKPQDLPVVSVISIAGLRRPRAAKTTATGSTEVKSVFTNPEDRVLTKDKMGLCLRIAAQRGHGLLVLGALGCGAFANPPEEVAHCWLEVLKEDEFKGGWWKELWFAVFDWKNEGNFSIFSNIMDGQEVRYCLHRRGLHSYVREIGFHTAGM
jgi:uncharacterized protein (TIGR02452 family)